MRTHSRSSLGVGTSLLPPAAVQDGTRRRILEVALQQFASRGFHGASIRDLATALELQPSALYAHFPSKEHILAELVRVGHEAHHEALRAPLLAAGADPIDQLRAIVRAHALVHTSYPQLAVVVNDEMYALSPKLIAPGLALRNESTVLLRQVIERGVAMGRFAPLHVGATVAAIGAMGLRIPHWYEPGGEISAEALADTYAELAVRMLKPT